MDAYNSDLCIDKAAHKAGQERLLSADRYSDRSDGRKYLLKREGQYKGLLDLERRFNPSLEEPLKVAG